MLEKPTSRRPTTGLGATLTSRRTFLRGAAVGATAGVAGCLGAVGGGGDTGPISIGVLLPYSGTLSVLGRSITQGLELRLDEINHQINGRDVTYTKRDTQAKPSVGVTNAKDFLEQKNVDFIVGPVSSAVAAAMLPLVEKSASAIWVNPNAGNDNLIKKTCTKYHFRVAWSNWHNSAPMGPWAYKNVADNVYLTYSDFVAGDQYQSDFAKTFTDAGGTIVGRTAVPLGTSDFAPYLQKVKNSNADAIWSFIPGADGVKYIKQIHSFGLDQQMTQMGTGFLFTQLTLAALGEAAVGKYSILDYTWNKDIPRNNQFKKGFENKFNQRANYSAVNGYDAVQAIELAVKQSGGTKPDPIVPVLEGAELDSPRGTYTIDAARHDPYMEEDIRKVVPGSNGNPPVNKVVDDLGKFKVPWTLPAKCRA